MTGQNVYILSRSALKFRHDLSLGVDTVVRHVRYLRDAFLLWQCPVRADNKWIAKPGTQDKLYAVDPVIARLSRLRNAARLGIDVTALVEMQLGMALRRHVLSRNKQASMDEFLFYYRTPTRKEIDFVSEYLGEVAIEGKYVQTGTWVGESATVNASPYQGILATRNVLDTANTDSAWPSRRRCSPT
jgi:predicted AAA+ superfamily ATPase